MSNRTLTVAAIQTSYGNDLAGNIAKTEAFVRQAAKRGAQVVLPSELFQGIYFPTRQDPKWFATALPVTEHPCVLALQKLAINRTQEAQGFRQALLQGAEVDAIAHASPAVRTVNRHIADNGLKDALAAFRRGDLV